MRTTLLCAPLWSTSCHRTPVLSSSPVCYKEWHHLHQPRACTPQVLNSSAQSGNSILTMSMILWEPWLVTLENEQPNWGHLVVSEEICTCCQRKTLRYLKSTQRMRGNSSGRVRRGWLEGRSTWKTVCMWTTGRRGRSPFRQTKVTVWPLTKIAQNHSAYLRP